MTASKVGRQPTATAMLATLKELQAKREVLVPALAARDEQIAREYLNGGPAVTLVDLQDREQQTLKHLDRAIEIIARERPSVVATETKALAEDRLAVIVAGIPDSLTRVQEVQDEERCAGQVLQEVTTRSADERNNAIFGLREGQLLAVWFGLPHPPVVVFPDALDLSHDVLETMSETVRAPRPFGVAHSASADAVERRRATAQAIKQDLRRHGGRMSKDTLAIFEAADLESAASVKKSERQEAADGRRNKERQEFADRVANDPMRQPERSTLGPTESLPQRIRS